MPNDYGTVMTDLPLIQEGFETCIARESTTAWMDENANPSTIRWISKREVRTLSMSIDGFGDAPAECECYPIGKASFDTNIYQLGIIRTRRQCFGEDMVDDFGGAYPVVTEFVRQLKEEAISEIDAFRWSKIAQYAATAGHIAEGQTYDGRVDSEKLIDDIQTGILSALDNRFKEHDLIIAINSHVKANVLDKYSGGSCCSIDVNGNIVNMVNSYNAVRFVIVPNAEFNSLIQLKNGSSGDFGWIPADTSKKINFIVMAKKAPIGLVKHNKINVFDSSKNRCGDSVDITAKIRHDLLVTRCNVGSLFVNTQ